MHGSKILVLINSSLCCVHHKTSLHWWESCEQGVNFRNLIDLTSGLFFLLYLKQSPTEFSWKNVMSNCWGLSLFINGFLSCTQGFRDCINWKMNVLWWHLFIGTTPCFQTSIALIGLQGKHLLGKNKCFAWTTLPHLCFSSEIPKINIW